MKKYMAWFLYFVAAVIVLWLLLLLIYFNSSYDSNSSLKITYEAGEKPYASFTVQDYSQNKENQIRSIAGDFAKVNSMEIKYSPFIQIHAVDMNLKNTKVHINFFQIGVNNDLHVFLYKQKLWKNMSAQEHRLLFEKLIDEFKQLNFELKNIKFIEDRITVQ